MDDLTLIGMPGSGKSTVGVVLAKMLAMDFVDTDLLIQQREGALLQQLIDRYGNEAFLDMEEAAICSVHCRRSVIAPGGSVIYRQGSIDHLKKLGPVVYLEVPFDELLVRLGDVTQRGIALAPGQSLEELYQARCPRYAAAADLVVDCSGYQDIQHTAHRVIRQLRALGHLAP
jgi:shikimate kinase